MPLREFPSHARQQVALCMSTGSRSRVGRFFRAQWTFQIGPDVGVRRGSGDPPPVGWGRSPMGTPSRSRLGNGRRDFRAARVSERTRTLEKRTCTNRKVWSPMPGFVSALSNTPCNAHEHSLTVERFLRAQWTFQIGPDVGVRRGSGDPPPVGCFDPICASSPWVGRRS